MRWLVLTAVGAASGCFFSLPEHASPGAGAGADGDYPAAVEHDHPLAYYRLDEKPGATVASDVLGLHDGTYSGDAGLGAPGLLAGSEDKAVYFDGRTSVHTTLTLAGDFTLEALVRPDGIPPADGAYEGVIFGAEKYLSTGFRFGIIDDHSLMFWCSESGCPSGTKVTSAAGALVFGAAHHIAAVYSNANVTLAIDGVEKAKGPMPLVPTTEPLRIGSATSSAYFQGAIDEVAIYARALSLEELRAHAMAAGFAR